MTLIVTYSDNPEWRPRHILAVAGQGLVVRQDTGFVEQLPSALLQHDALRKQQELTTLAKQYNETELLAWYARQGINVSLLRVDAKLHAELSFAFPLQPNSSYVVQTSHFFGTTPPPGWFERVERVAQKHAATADHPFEGHRSVRCLIRRPLLQPMSPDELLTLKTEVREVLDALARDAA